MKDSFVLFRISFVRTQYSHIVAPIKKQKIKHDLTVKGGKNGGASFLFFFFPVFPVLKLISTKLPVFKLVYSANKKTIMKITKRSILTLRPAILNDQSPRHCVKMKCFIVAQLKRNLVKVLIKVCPTESRGVLNISQSATKLW